MRSLVLTLVVAAAFTACGGSSASPVSPTTPAASAASLTGTWSGSSSDTTGAETMNWTVSQSGSSVTATMGLNNSSRGMMGNGTMQGTMNGTTLTFHMTVPSGGFNGTMGSCAMAADGQATVSADGHTMTGTYSGNMSGMMSGGMMGQSCGGAMNNGQFTLTR